MQTPLLVQGIISFFKQFHGSNINFDKDTAIHNFDWVKSFGTSSNKYLNTFIKFLIFRLFSMLSMLGILAWSLYDSYSSNCISVWYVYLTNWSLIITAIYSITAVCSTIKLRSSNHKYLYNQERIPDVVKLCWGTQNLAFTSSTIVSICYWLFVWDRSSIPEVIMFFTHGVNMFIILLDVFLSNQPVMIIHSIYSTLFGGLYFLWTYLHYKFDLSVCIDNHIVKGKIYDVIDWSNPEFTTKLCFALLLVAIPLLNIFAWFIYFRKREKKIPQHVGENSQL